MFPVVQQYSTGTHSSQWEEPRQPHYREMVEQKTSSMEIMVNTIEAIIMDDQSLRVRELGAMLDNFCTSFFSSVKFGRVNSNRFYTTRWFRAVVSFSYHFCRSLTLFFRHLLQLTETYLCSERNFFLVLLYGYNTSKAIYIDINSLRYIDKFASLHTRAANQW